MIFTTPRLIIRKLNEKDIADFHEMHSNPKVMQYTSESTKTLEEDQKDLKHVISCYTKTNNDFWVWAVERKSDHKVIGTCAIIRFESDYTSEEVDEIGYRFAESAWGNGYATEVTEGLIQFAFEKMGKTKLVGEVDELNVASVKILEKFMLLEKTYYNEKCKSNDRLYRVLKQ